MPTLYSRFVQKIGQLQFAYATFKILFFKQTPSITA